MLSLETYDYMQQWGRDGAPILLRQCSRIWLGDLRRRFLIGEIMFPIRASSSSKQSKHVRDQINKCLEVVDSQAGKQAALLRWT